MHMSEQAVDGAAGPGKQSRALYSPIIKAPKKKKAVLNEQVGGSEKSRAAHSCGSTLTGKS